MKSFKQYLGEARFKSIGRDNGGWRFGVSWTLGDKMGTVKTKTDQAIQKKRLESAGAKFERSTSRSHDEEFVIPAFVESEARTKVKKALGGHFKGGL